MNGGVTVRRVRSLAVCALLTACALIAGASAQELASASKPARATTKDSTKGSASKASASAASKSKTHTASAASKKHRKKSARVRGQQKIDSERAQAIQEALIREHYLKGEATGTWNQASEEAMRRYQADNGWQSKTVPDSRALIKLGLGPSQDHLLNPESAMTTSPASPRAEPLPTNSHSAPAVANPASPAVPAATPASSNTSSPQ